jgi:hypothetical protein
MKRLVPVLLLLFLFHSSFAQLQIGVFGGAANYQGDLSDLPFKPLKPAIGITTAFEFSDLIKLRADFTKATVAGSDKAGGSKFQTQTRNLSFESKIDEANLLVEYTVFGNRYIKLSPYIFAGVGFFRFNPYTFDSANNKVYLKPLSTEGQGLSQYPERKPYSLSGLAIPFGGGLRFAITENIQLGAELGLRKLFTDYLDDISTTYIDPAILREERGQLAVDLSYRGDEVPGETVNYPDNGYPAKGTFRGSPKGKDWYYFTTFRLLYRLPDIGAIKISRGSKRTLRCPVVRM